MTYLLPMNWSQYKDRVFRASVWICARILEEEVLLDCGFAVFPACHNVAIYFCLVK